MKSSFSVLVFLGSATYEAEAVSLKSYIQMLEASEIENHDWDDMLDKTEVFGSASYSSDSPDGYDSIVDEVMQDQDKAI